MKSSRITSLVLTAALCRYGHAYAQQPPDVVQSDAEQNTAMGTGALQSASVPPNPNAPDSYNDTAVGFNALNSNIIGTNNTAIGTNALATNTIGYGNTATGSFALHLNTTGVDNTAAGISAMEWNTSGVENTASGFLALQLNTTGNNNTALGAYALWNSSTASENTAAGHGALVTNTTGSYNTASGSAALSGNVSGSYNVAAGFESMASNTTGSDNTAIGLNALGTNQGGSNNIAIGANAGYYIRGSRYNIDIGNTGNQQDVGLIRIGTSGQQSAAYIAGISGAHVTGSAVYVTSTGQLGVLASSERYKTGIAPMGASTEKLDQLRPVTFRLKTDAKRTVQYGLIAEEVAKVYPELVIRDGADKIQGVRYEELAPMLLNEAQQQRKEIDQLKQQLAQLQAMVKLQTKSELVAER